MTATTDTTGPLSPRVRVTTVAGGAALLAALAVAQIHGRPAALVVLLAALGAAIVAIQAAPTAWNLLSRRRALLLTIAVAALIAGWLAAGIGRSSSVLIGWPHTPNGSPFSFGDQGGIPYIRFWQVPVNGWPWRLGRLSLPLLLLALLCAAGGLVLMADAVRVQLGPVRPTRSPWRALTAGPSQGGRAAARAVPGVALIGVATFLGISLASRYVSGNPPLATVLILLIAGGAVLLIVSPLAAGAAMRHDFDKAGRAREEERSRFAAHLHDSVLQTLALIQRQSHDAAAVARLARRQEHALRAWMAGEAELTSDTLAAAVRDVVSEVEDEYGITIELTAIGDHALDARGEALAAAAREALRNAARHAPGARIYAFLDVNPERAELFVRDDGPGFALDDVPPERRGIRDAVLGRMKVVGGDASLESTGGEGTEVALRLPYNGRHR